jgi:nicotinamide mononucleotide transporter
MPWALCAPGIALSYTPGAIAAFEGRNDMDFLRWLFEAQIPVRGSVLVLREVPGNIFGLTSALGGMRRKVWAWPIGIAVYGWYRWRQGFQSASQGRAVVPGWTEFWLIWVAVDIVGVPLLFSAGYFASAFMYLFYGFFTLAGFFVWWRADRRESQPLAPTAEPETAGALS